ncbi:MAG: nitroreductase family protein [Chlorobiaceae bacterium]
MNETIQTILKRRSVRVYQPKQIDEKEMQLIVQAGQNAPSAMGQQPWHFTVLQNSALLEKLEVLCKASFLNSDNQALREMASREEFRVFYHAPTLVIISGDSKAIAPLQDCTLAMENMLLAATSFGIGSCWVHSPMMVYEGPEGPASLNALGLNFPECHRPYAAAVFGYSNLPLPEAGARKTDTVTFVR